MMEEENEISDLLDVEESACTGSAVPACVVPGGVWTGSLFPARVDSDLS